MTAKKTGNRRSGPSLETRIFLVTSLLIALLVGGAVAVTSILLRGIARDAVLESLRSSAAAQGAFQDQRYRQLLVTSRQLATDPYVSAYVSDATAVGDTLRSSTSSRTGSATCSTTSPSCSPLRGR